MPIAHLYNEVGDGRAVNLEPCARAELPVQSRTVLGDGAQSTSTLLRVAAPHAYGAIDLNISVVENALVFTVVSVTNWTVSTKIIAFGEFWMGHLDNRATSPIVMGKLQGPRSLSGLPGGGAPAWLPSSGYATLSRRGYYRYLLNATVGDAVGFLFGPTATIDADWIALGKSRQMSQPRSHRFASWYVDVSLWDNFVLPLYCRAFNLRAVGNGVALHDHWWAFS